MINTDSLNRRLYATDASMYEELPHGVSFPKTISDIQQVVEYAQANALTITPRGAGTSLAGQATGSGMILDTSRHLNGIIELNVEKQFARVQPGVIRDTLNRELSPLGFLFGPDTSTTNRCNIGGMIGNNSSGSFSIKYQTTREHVQEIEAVLSDGSVVCFKALSPSELEEKMALQNLEGAIYRGMISLLKKHESLIKESYPHPEIIRRNTGYALDKLLEMAPFTEGGRPFNLCELLCGSEGTLAITASAKVGLSKLDKIQRMVIPQFESVHDALVATVEAVKLDPSAVELVDNIILDTTKGNLEHVQNRFFLDGEPKAILIIQFEGDSEIELQEKCETLVQLVKERKLGYAYPIVKKSEEMKRVWDLRKAGLGLLMGLGKEARSPTFCEDTAVRVEDLPNYIQDFEALLKRHDTECVFYAHASVGELHLRPMIDTSTTKGVEKMKEMAIEIADLVGKYKGSLSGEHGDGRARAPYIEQVLGKEMIPVLRQVKELWDPNYILNPGKIVNPKPIDSDLRFSPSYKIAPVHTEFKWRKEDGYANAIDLCNGAGVCRKLSESGGTMCPSYMATTDEKDSTRGRANIFRHVFSGEQPEQFESEDLKDALSLCLSCKACKSECPANVDMARMKAEFMQGWIDKKGTGLQDLFFTQSAKFYGIASLVPSFSNWLIHSNMVKGLLEEYVGLSSKRRLPSFAQKPFHKLLPSLNLNSSTKEKVVLIVDVFTRYHEPDIAVSAIEVLTKMGYGVQIADFQELGRPHLSRGLVREAKKIMQHNLPMLNIWAEKGMPIIGLEPSEILTIRDEYVDLCEDTDLDMVQNIAALTYTFEEFIEGKIERVPVRGGNQKLTLHDHCHAKALSKRSTTNLLFTKLGFDVQELDSGCCGMAGSFGYEKENEEVSLAIAEQRLAPAIRKAKDRQVCAPGFSCRHQISDTTERNALHTAQILKNNLK